jgi:hypothetical protein
VCKYPSTILYTISFLFLFGLILSCHVRGSVSNCFLHDPQFFFLFLSWGGVRLSPLGMSANILPIVPAPDDRWWVWSSRWNENWQRKPKYSKKTCPSATLPTTNPTWPDLGSNPGSRGGKPATNRLSYGTAFDPQLMWVRSSMQSQVYLFQASLL